MARNGSVSFTLPQDGILGRSADCLGRRCCALRAGGALNLRPPVILPNALCGG